MHVSAGGIDPVAILKTATLLETRGIDVEEMGVTRLMWISLCLAEDGERRMKRDAMAARLGQADEKSWKRHMGD